MYRKAIYLILIGLNILNTIPSISNSLSIKKTDVSAQVRFEKSAGNQADDYLSDFDLDQWLITDETSVWTAEELELLQSVMLNTFGALAEVGLDGNVIFDGYAFRRFPGKYAKNKDGKIALVNYADQEIVLSDSIFLPEYEFFIYHELGHIVDHRSGHLLDKQFHTLTLQIDGVTALHDWTTAQGFYLRGQAHIKKSEATADAFALWVWVTFAGKEMPHFHHTPENANPEAILQVFSQAFKSSYQQQMAFDKGSN